ncbi:hypothetical protein [Methylacidimicrobium sp. B4]|uniref:hypothetical protein n=1 Tax=Methylacidimicrobium sp. B4 TaxID=2796139 RepID=UPI001A8C983F|nr:hypothetical protein [Methylacidimicrobium sp. B4]QSR84508.1 hypothetical protein MacB4_09950 [Methylacidimicrobium sp. B4]
MPAKRCFLPLSILFAVFCSCLALSSPGVRAASRAPVSSEGAPAGMALWKTYPEGGGYFQQRQDAPIIVIPGPPRLPVPAAPEGAVGQHGRIPRQKVVPSFIPNEAMETGAFSGGL